MTQPTGAADGQQSRVAESGARRSVLTATRGYPEVQRPGRRGEDGGAQNGGGSEQGSSGGGGNNGSGETKRDLAGLQGFLTRRTGVGRAGRTWSHTGTGPQHVHHGMVGGGLHTGIWAVRGSGNTGEAVAAVVGGEGGAVAVARHGDVVAVTVVDPPHAASGQVVPTRASTRIAFLHTDWRRQQTGCGSNTGGNTGGYEGRVTGSG